MEVRSRRVREISPDRAKVCMQPRIKPIKKVQVVYYLTRNGQLEHPHYMEVTHLANHPLRLKDVMDRLTILRGKGMPALYSWSCKRSYKNGYVWNDLAENDIIYPSDGAEYVLKGSELVDGCSEKFQQQLHLSSCSRQLIQLHQEPNYFPSKRKMQTVLPSTDHLHKEPAAEEPDKSTMYEDQDYQEEEEEYEEDEEKSTSYTSSTTPHSRCSRGVSTDEPDEQPEPPPKTLTESTTTTTHHNSPPPPPPSSLSSILSNGKPAKSNNTSKRFEDGDPVVAGSAPSRNSVLLQLISCGNLAVARAKNTASFKPTANDNAVKRCSSDLHRGVLYRTAVKVAEEEDMISYMSENPRFGNLQAEEKEYFSGSIVESVSKDRVQTPPVLKRSNSYNEERSCKAGLEEMASKQQEEEKRKSYGVKGKCIPRKKSSSSSKKIIRK